MENDVVCKKPLVAEGKAITFLKTYLKNKIPETHHEAYDAGKEEEFSNIFFFPKNADSHNKKEVVMKETPYSHRPLNRPQETSHRDFGKQKQDELEEYETRQADCDFINRRQVLFIKNDKDQKTYQCKRYAYLKKDRGRAHEREHEFST